MTETQEKKKDRRGLWIALAIIVVVGVIIVWRVSANRSAQLETLANLETVPYQRKTLSANIYGTGTVEAFQSAVLIWPTGGTVGEVYVSLGETVAKDELLMALDPGSVSVDILQAQIDVINVQNQLDDLYDHWEADLAQAKLDLLNAQEDLDDLATDRQIMNYQRCTDERIEDLEDELDQAETIYHFRQNADTLKAVNTAQANLDYCNAAYTAEEIAEAELKVELGEAKVADLQKQVDLLSDGPDPDQVTILETQLSIAQSRLDSPRIEAPFDGTVTALPAQVGDVVQAGAQAVQLDNLSKLYLDVPISEVDIAQVAMGQPVRLVFDAYYNDTFTGEVTEIAPVGTAVQGVVEYTVRIDLEDADGRIRTGMTAAVNILVEEKEDILVVPNDAIVLRDGQEYVFVKRNGTYVDVPVTLGAYSDDYSEVIEAEIAEGELILLNPPAAITGGSSFAEGPGGGFSGFGN